MFVAIYESRQNHRIIYCSTIYLVEKYLLLLVFFIDNGVYEPYTAVARA